MWNHWFLPTTLSQTVLLSHQLLNQLLALCLHYKYVLNTILILVPVDTSKLASLKQKPKDRHQFQ